MKTYLVGGAVRDELLGLTVQDKDWVVVGASPEQMIAAGFRPVGKDFPVFIHPQSGEEYALARTERKTAKGYRGFAFHCAPDVSLEQDLLRRDLTVNAIAKDELGTLIDPYNGQQDITHRVFRHVSAAFSEDPVRILRTARFAARFTDFSVHSDTNLLMHQMVSEGEVDALVPERVWQEIERGLMEKKPSRMIEVLNTCDAFNRLFELSPSAPALSKISAQIDLLATQQAPLETRFAMLGIHLSSASLQRLRLPTPVLELTELAQKQLPVLEELELEPTDLPPEATLALLLHCDVIRRPERFIEFLHVAETSFATGMRNNGHAHIFKERWQLLSAAIRDVNAGNVAKQVAPSAIKDAVYKARLGAVKIALEKMGNSPR